MLGERIVDNTDEGHEIMCEGEGDGDIREGVDEIGGTVDGVTDECRRRGKEGRSRRGG